MLRCIIITCIVKKSYSIAFGTVFSVFMGGNFRSVKEAKLSKTCDTHLCGITLVKNGIMAIYSALCYIQPWSGSKLALPSVDLICSICHNGA